MFRDRVDAGRRLADVVQHAGIGGGGAVVLGLPRGGVPVAAEVARVARRSARRHHRAQARRSRPSRNWPWGLSVRTGCGWRTRTSWRRWCVDDVDMEAIEQRERGELTRRARQYRQERASARPPGSLRRHCGRRDRHRLDRPCRLPRRPRPRRGAGRARRACCPESYRRSVAGRLRRLPLRGDARSRSLRWGSGTTTSSRRPTTRSCDLLRRKHLAVGERHGVGRAARRGDHHLRRG